jgi:hypothetical protein
LKNVKTDVGGRAILRSSARDGPARCEVELMDDEASIDTIEVELSNLERRREDPDVQALAHGVRRDPKAVTKIG